MKVLQQVTLCPACGECPEIRVVEREDGQREVQFDEGGCSLKLPAKAWNDLVARIRSGELKEV